jgi:hypothetical protein
VEEETLTLDTEILEPALIVAPEENPVPVMVTFSAVPTKPCAGEIPLITGGGTTLKDVEPTVGFVPSEFETFAVIVAVPADIPWTITLVLWVNVPVGLTMAAGPVMESEIGTVFDEGVTVAVIVAVCPTPTEILENDTEGVTLPVEPPPPP